MMSAYSVKQRNSALTISTNIETPYPSSPYSSHAKLTGISSHYSLSADPRNWGSDIWPNSIEPDDELHDPTWASRKLQSSSSTLSWRCLSNFGCLIVLLLSIIVLFLGYPLVVHFTQTPMSTYGGFNLGGINATGQVPKMNGNWGLIDLDTPKSAYTKRSWVDGKKMALVFSDEFNVDGRSFYPGDDPYWEAADLHYWATNNVEWYDPEAVTTSNGSLVITLSRKLTHDLNYQGGMVTTWNKFCFIGGYIETSVQLPGANNVLGFWPAVWTMGNLGRAGYGASLQGLWPYTYDSCDVGTAPNQTINGLPIAATQNGDQYNDGRLSFLPGQRLSRCTCPGENHPGPVHADGTYVGRSAPEIDIFEALINSDELVGQVSQSAQWAPFDETYIWKNTSANIQIPNPLSKFNPYTGGVLQQATSVLTYTNPMAYEEHGQYSVYGFEYEPGFDTGYITWISDNKVSWTLRAPGMGPNPAVQIAARPVPQEPMYIIVNLGMSENFGPIDFDHLTFPSSLRVDYIRVYQPSNAVNVGCDPKDFPTGEYIKAYLPAYANPNLTTWVDDFDQPWPKNRLVTGCT